MSQGGRANFTGRELEELVRNRVKRAGYLKIDSAKFKTIFTGFFNVVEKERPVFSTQYHIGRSIYDTKLYTDLILYHPEKYPKALAIEIKWQQISGSVDEKYPYLVENIRKKFPCPAIIILDGGGYKIGAENWLRAQTDDKLLHVFNMLKFQTWVNNGGI